MIWKDFSFCFKIKMDFVANKVKDFKDNTRNESYIEVKSVTEAPYISWTCRIQKHGFLKELCF